MEVHTLQLGTVGIYGLIFSTVVNVSVLKVFIDQCGVYNKSVNIGIAVSVKTQCKLYRREVKTGLDSH